MQDCGYELPRRQALGNLVNRDDPPRTRHCRCYLTLPLFVGIVGYRRLLRSYGSVDREEYERRTVIETANLRLIPCELEHFEAILTDQKQLERMLGVTVFDNWFDFPGVAGIEAIRFSYEYLKANPDTLGWWTYLIVHVKDNVLIGQCGYKGEADESGMVEIGYAIVQAYRRRGLATEAARGLIDHAFMHTRVKKVDAHTLAERNASVRVLEKAGMNFMEAVEDPEVGEIWHWSLCREDHAQT